MNYLLNYIIVLVIIVICFLLYDKFNLTNNEIKIQKPHKIKNKKIKKHKTKNKKNKKQKKNQDFVFLEIGTNGKKLGKIIIELFSEIVPLTCENFRTLCINGLYKKSCFHRIIRDFMLQGGDFTNGDGTGGKSIFGKTFKDENFKIKHDKPYLLSMANRGKDTNGSQFFITTAPANHLDNKHVVFGRVVSGNNIVDILNTVETDGNDKPIYDVFITNCGKFDSKK